MACTAQVSQGNVVVCDLDWFFGYDLRCMATARLEGLVMASNLVFVALLSYVMMSAVRTDLRPHLLQKSYRNVEFHSAQSLINNTAFADLYERAFNHGIPSFQDSPSLVILGVALIIIFFKELAELRSEVNWKRIWDCFSVKLNPYFVACSSGLILWRAVYFFFLLSHIFLRNWRLGLQGYRYFFEWMNWMEMLLFLTVKN